MWVFNVNKFLLQQQSCGPSRGSIWALVGVWHVTRAASSSSSSSSDFSIA
uniref:Uncharacterized protein n=1 Tax=Anguilla anguilla TaxID=7936 RepID=A0A0E9UUK6_ANGAN